MPVHDNFMPQHLAGKSVEELASLAARILVALRQAVWDRTHSGVTDVSIRLGKDGLVIEVDHDRERHEYSSCSPSGSAYAHDIRTGLYSETDRNSVPDHVGIVVRDKSDPYWEKGDWPPER